MAITIYEIIASDTVSQFADKVNYNFDQLLQNGGGPAGPQGPQGPFGPTGPQGVAGPQGIRGSKWFQGSSFPVSGANINDLFLDSSGIVYEYNGSTWVTTGIDLVGTGTVWDQLDGSSTSVSTSLPRYEFRYVRPSYDYSTSSGGLSNEQAILIGGAPYGAAIDQGITGAQVDYVSDTYTADIDTNNGSLFVHAPKELGIGRNIILSRIQGDGSSSYNTDIVSEMSYITLDVADGIEIVGQKRVTNSLISGSYPNGISLSSSDSQTYIGAGRNITIQTFNPITGYSSGVFGSNNSVGNILIHAQESTLSGYGGAALTLKKGTSGALGDATIILGNANPTQAPVAGDSTIYMRNAGTSSDFVMLSGRSIVTTSGRSFSINTPGTSNIALDVRGGTTSSQLISVKRNNSVEAFGLSSSGRLTQALAFPSAGVNSTDANSLDYYEEGAWTPVLSVFNPGSISGTFGTSGTSNYSVRKARYTRIGNTVTLDAVFNITIPSSLGCPGSPDFYQSGLVVTGFPYQPDIEHSTVASSGANVEYGMPFYSAGAHNIAGNCSTIPIAGSVKASFYCASTSGSAMAFYVNDVNTGFGGPYYKSMRRLSFVDYQGSTNGVLNFSANYLVTSDTNGNPCSTATSGTSGTSGTGNGTGFSVLSQVQAPLTANSLAVENSTDLMTWSAVSNLTRSLVGTSVSTSTGLNESAYYRATLTNNTFGTSTFFQGLTWLVSGGSTSGPISTSGVSTAGSGNSVTWFAPSPWTPGSSYIWEGRFGSLPSFTLISDTPFFPDYRIQVFEVGSNVVAGYTYSLTVYSVTVFYTAQVGDTANDVATGLAAVVNNTTTSQWNAFGSAPIGNPYFPPTANASGSQISLTLNWQNSFSGSVSTSPPPSPPLTNVTVDVCGSNADGSGNVTVYAYADQAVDANVNVQVVWLGDLFSNLFGSVTILSGNNCGSTSLTGANIGEGFSSIQISIINSGSSTQSYVSGSSSGPLCPTCAIP
jgi:hypothetical protein